MARSRNIKPGFFDNDLLAEVAPLGRLLFIAMWTLADRDGKLEDRPAKIKKQALGYDECDIEALLEALASRGFILRYSVDGTGYIKVLNWHKHQQPHVKEVASIIPDPVEHGSSTVQAPDKHGASTGQESLIPDSLNLIPDSTKEVPPTPLETAPPAPQAEKPPRVKKLKTTELKPESVEAFQAAWETIPASVVRWDATVRREVEEAVAKGSRAEAERNFQAIVDAKIATPRTLYVALYAYITEGEGPRKGFVQHCATFYGPKKRTYLEWLERARELETERYGVSA